MAKALNRRDSSLVNDLPALPCGILNKFLLQCTTSLKEESNRLEKLAGSTDPQTKVEVHDGL